GWGANPSPRAWSTEAHASHRQYRNVCHRYRNAPAASRFQDRCRHARRGDQGAAATSRIRRNPLARRARQPRGSGAAQNRHSDSSKAVGGAGSDRQGARGRVARAKCLMPVRRLSDFALRFGLALIVVAVAIVAIIISRRNYAKSADFERGIDALRLELRRSIDAAHAATVKNVATTIRDNIFSVIRPIDSTVRDFDDRLARLEQQHADAAASHMAGTQLLDVRLARLEEHTDTTAIQNLDGRLARLEERADDTATQNFDGRLAKLEQHAETTETQNLDVRLGQLEERADANATQIAGAHKQSLEENERLGAR